MKKIGFLALLVLVVSFGGFGITACSAPASLHSVSEIKLFTLQERTVVAVAIEDRIPGKEVENVLGYHLTPVYEEKRSADRWEVILSNVTPTWKELPAGLPLSVENMGMY